MEGQFVGPLSIPKDFFGVEFVVGQYFVKPERQSSSLYMIIGKVVGFKIRNSYAGSKKLPVVRTISPYHYPPKSITGEVRRKAIMECPERAVIIWHSQVPVQYITAFDEAEKKIGREK